MTTDRWTEAKLDTLADTVEQLVNQVQQLSQQLGQLGTRLDRTTHSLDALVMALANRPSPPEAPPPPSEPQADGIVRITLLEEQLLHLTQRVQSLERRGFSVSTVATTMSIAADEDDEIEDEPDEILWDFMEPNPDHS